MKTFVVVLFAAFALEGCTPPKSSETASPDSVATEVAKVDSVVSIAAAKVESLEISDSAAVVIRDVVNAQLEAFLADTTQVYEVKYFDYFDEWEGQATMEIQTWYLDKNFAVVYYSHSFETGTMDDPDFDQYLLKDNILICSKKETGGGPYTKIITLWDAGKGGVQATKDESLAEGFSFEATPAAYAAEIQKAPSDLYIPDVLLELKPDVNGDIYTLVKEVPKQAELTDYTKAVLPKAVYDKLRKDQ